MGTLTRRASAGLALAALAAVLSACTGGSGGTSSATHAPSPSVSATTATPRPVPLVVRVTRVSGSLRPATRRSLEQHVGRTVSAYFDAAFLAGDYPRSDFSGAFAGFTPGAARKASRDAALLTNRSLGATTVSVRPRTQVAYLSVLAPHRIAAGVTARVRLVYVAERGDRPAKRVELSGRLLLTRARSGGWQIFGYDLARSTTDAGGRS